MTAKPAWYHHAGGWLDFASDVYAQYPARKILWEDDHDEHEITG
jgi:hypothetical protein